MRLRLILIIATFGLVARGAHALSSSDLVHDCRGAKLQRLTVDEADDLWFCSGYVQGFVDKMVDDQMMVDAITHKPLMKQFVCVPSDGIQTSELILVYLKFMDDHPEQLHLPSTLTLHNAVLKAYRCPTS